MGQVGLSKDTNWFFLTLPAFLGSNHLLDPCILFSLLLAFLSLSLFTWAFSPGGMAWRNNRNHHGPTPIPGPRAVPLFGSLFTLSRGLAHRSLALTAKTLAATELMAFSLGSVPAVVSSNPKIAKEILTSPHFADRPVKQSARLLMFSRAMGFAPNGAYWRLLRRISSTHLFSPRRILAHSSHRQLECAVMVGMISPGRVSLRKHLQVAALNNVMMSVFGRRYDDSVERDELNEMVREGFELLGAFNWSDYIPWLNYLYDPVRVVERCEKLVPRVRKVVRGIIEEHRVGGESKGLSENGDFVDVLLSLEGEEKLDEDDMIAVLWEMIFRGTDTTALLTEWVMAELVLHPEIQTKLFQELQSSLDNTITDADVARIPYLQAVVKETLRLHPPGPLLSWARLSTSDVHLSNGMMIPAHTTAMVNMWAITHDPHVWEDPEVFDPERFIVADVDVRGGDLRLAPFGAGRRVCPGKNFGLATVSLWVAELVRRFKWVPDEANPVDLSEVLKLSCEMKHPLSAVALARNVPLH